MKSFNPRCGFTLIEVLVALVILSVALTALIKTASQNTINTSTLRNKYLGSVVASNKLAELYIAGAWPGTGNSNGTAELADQNWQWSMKVDNTADASLRRITIKISPEFDKDKIVYTTTSFLVQP